MIHVKVIRIQVNDYNCHQHAHIKKKYPADAIIVILHGVRLAKASKQPGKTQLNKNLRNKPHISITHKVLISGYQ